MAAVRTNASRYDVQVDAVRIVMAKDNIGLVSESHVVHIIMGDLQQPAVIEVVFRMRIQGDMEYGVLDPGAGMRKVWAHSLGHTAYIESSVDGGNRKVMAQEGCSRSVVDFDLIVEKHARYLAAEVYSGNHFSRSSSLREAICSLRALSWRV